LKPIPFNNSYINLGKDFYVRTRPSPVANPELIKFNQQLSDELGLSDTCLGPVYIPRNHQIEAAIRAAEDNNDFSVFHNLHEVLQRPYELQPQKDTYMLPPEPDEVVQQTFCGT